MKEAAPSPPTGGAGERPVAQPRELGPGPANLAFDGTRYLSVWTQSNDIYGRFIDRTGSPSGGPFLITGLAGNQSDAVAAFNGSHDLVAWYDNGSGDAIKARLVSAAGQLLGSELVVASASNSRGTPAVASDGTDFLVVWADDRNFATNFSDVMGQRVTASAAGAALAGANFLVSPAAQTQFQPSVAYGAGTYLVAWTNDITSNGGQRDVYGALVSSAGVTSAQFPVSTAASGQRQPSVAFGGGNFLVVFDDLRFNGNRDDVYAVRVSPAGVLLDGDGATGGVAVSTNAGFGSPHAPRAVFNGTDWLVVWAGTQTVGARVGTDGTLRDATPINLYRTATSHWFPAVAFDGTNCYVTWANQNASYAKSGQLVVLTPVDQLVTTAEDTPVAVTLGATDADGDALTPTILTAPAHGTLTGTFPNLTYTPAANYNGTDLFTYKVNDGQADSNTATVRLTITAVNDAPTTAADAYSVNEDGSLTVTAPGVLANDSDPRGVRSPRSSFPRRAAAR
jgi:hypothetical protein